VPLITSIRRRPSLRRSDIFRLLAFRAYTPRNDNAVVQRFVILTAVA